MQDEAEVCCGDEKQRELKTTQPMKRHMGNCQKWQKTK